MDHSRIVQLAQFDINTDKLQDSVLESQKRLIDLNKEIYKSVQAMAQLQKSIDAANKTSDALNNSNKKTGDAYVETNKNVIELMESEKKLMAETQRLRAERDKLKADYDLQKGVLEEIRKKNIQVAASETNVADAVAREVNTRKQAKQNTKELNKLKDELNVNNKEEADLLDLINEKVNTNNKLLAESGSELEKRRANVGNYSSSIQDAFANIDIMNGGLGGFIARSNQAGGAGELLKGTFTEIKTGVTGIGKTIIATPIGAFITALAGIALAGKALYSYNNELEKTLKITKQFTGLAGDELEAVGVKINGIVDRTGASQKEVLQAVQSLVNDFGLSYNEAFDKINLGYQRAGSSAEDFFDNTAEYSTFLAQAGYNADEFFAIMQAGAQNGVYKDKILDSLKEVDIRLKEMPKSASDALLNAFGSNFAQTIAQGVKTGETTTKEALLLINKEADKTGLNFQQKGQLIADVFGSAGEDAGGFAKVLDSVTEGISKAGAGMTELETAQQASNNAQDEMNQAFADLFHISDGGFELMKSQLMEGVYTAITAVVDAIIDGYNWFANLYNESKLFAGIMNTTASVVKGVFTIITTGLKQTVEGFKGLGGVIEALFTGNFSELPSIIAQTTTRINAIASEGVKEITKNFSDAWNGNYNELELINKNTVKSVQNVGKEIVKSVSKNSNEVTKLTDAQKKAQEKLLDSQIAKQKDQLDLWIAQQGDKARTMQEELALQEEVSKKSIAILDNELKNKKITQDKYDLEFLKLKQETAKKQASIAVEAAQIELDAFEYENREKLKNGQLITDQVLDAELSRLKTVQQERDKMAKLENDSGLINQNELNQRKLQNEREYLEQEKNLREQNAQDNITIQTSLLQSKIEAENIALKGSEQNEYLSLKAKENQLKLQYQHDLLLLDEQLQNEKITKDQYDIMAKNLQDQNAQSQKEIDKAVFENKLQLASSTFANLAAIFGEESAAGKAMAVAQTTIDTYKSATSAYSAMSGIPIVGPVLGAIAAGAAVAAGLANVKKITSTKTPSISKGAAPKMAKGGLTEIGGRRHSQGGTKFVGEDGTRFEAEKGELIGVMNRSAAAHFMSYNNSFLSGGSKTYPNYFADGGIVGLKPSNNAAVLQNLFGNFDTSSITEAVRQGAMEGTQQGSFEGSYQGSQVGSQQGISQLSSNRVVQSGLNY